MQISKKLRMTALSGTVEGNHDAGMEEVGATLNKFDFFQSIRTNNFIEFNNMLSIDCSLLNAVSNDGFNGLQMAAKYGHADMVEALLDQKAETLRYDVKYGRTFLHWAAVNGHSDVVFLAVRDFPEILKSLIDLLDNKGSTSLMLAVKGGRRNIVSLLLASGADVNIKVKVNNVDKTVFDMCNNATEMLSLLNNRNSPATKASAAAEEATSPLTGSSNGDIQWGLSSGAGISQLAHNRTKCITLGWFRRSTASLYSQVDLSSPLLGSPAAVRTSSEAFGTGSEGGAVIQDVVVKLNLNPRELREEFAFREQLNSGVNSSSSSTNSTSSSSSSGGGCSAVARDDSVNYFVSAVCPTIVTLTEKSQLWYGILLEKGIVDLHHLYVAMTQHSTHSRLSDLRWKLKNIHRITRICGELLRRDLVWYDLKPSNFIVFSADETSKIRPHKWIQQSSWDSSTFRLKATDLSSIYAAGVNIPVSSISCTAKFLCPSVAKLLTTNSNCTTTIDSMASVASDAGSEQQRSDSGVSLTTDPAHMLWSLGMCALQLLSPEYSTVFSHLNLNHASEVYAFLNLEDDAIQQSIDEYIAGLVKKLMSEVQANQTIIEVNSELTESIGNGLESFLQGLLQVDDSKRCSISESLAAVESLLQMM